MNKGVLIVLAVIVSLSIFSAIAAAEFTYYSKGSSIESSYSAGEIIRGMLNMSFSEEPAASLFTSNLNSSIKLYDFLRNSSFSEGSDFNCTYKNCVSGFKTGEAITNDDGITLNEETPSFIGFKISGSMSDDIQIMSVKFSVTSGSSVPSCTRQMIIDVLDKNETFIQNNKNSGVACEEEYKGCFNDGLSNYISAIITSQPYCEKITLRPAPAYVLGATIKNGTKTTDLKMKLYRAGIDSVGDFIGECMLQKNQEETEKIGCNLNYSVVSEEDYYVCIEAKDDDSGHKIRIETREPLCGTNTMSVPYTIDYDIYAKPVAFDAIGTLVVNESLFAQQNQDAMLANYVDQYVQDNYNRNCTKGCIIPFKIGGIDQEITLSGIAMTYNAKGGTLYEDSMYKLQRENSRITAKTPLIIDLQKAGIKIPMSSTINKLYLYIAGKAILPNPLSIAITPSFDFDISPKTILAGMATQFSVITPASIISANWDFGDGITATSSGKIITHRYTNIQTEGYKVTVDLVRSDGVTSRRVFDVALGSLGEAARNLTSEYESRVKNLEIQMGTFGIAAARSLGDLMDIKNKNATLGQIKYNLINATTDAQYTGIIAQLMQLDLPYSIISREEGNALPFSIGFGNINTESIESISGITLDSSEKKESLKASIVSWMEKNYGGSIDYKVISQFSDENDKTGEAIATIVKVNLNRLGGAEESASDAYLVIEYPKNSVRFTQNYSEKSSGSATYLPVSSSMSVEFVLDGKITVQELGMHVSPDVSQLEGFGDVEVVEKKGFNWGRFILWTIILLIAAFVIYIALQEWYKRRYEAYLFKNPSDLYNIIHFMFNSRKNGLSDSDIEKKLKGTGWKGEQITYAFKKLDGKRTGMWEIPIFRFFEQKKVKEEIEKRQTAQKPVQPMAFR